MDLANLAAAQTVTGELKNPMNPKEVLRKDDGDPMTITVHTSQTATYRDALARVTRDKEVPPYDRATALLAASVIEADVTLGGKPATRADVVALLSDPAYGWLREQVENFVHDQTRFFAPASTD